MENSEVLLFAVFNGGQNITDQMFTEVNDFYTYIIQREKDNK